MGSRRSISGFCFVSVVGNDGFYVILKGLARPQTQLYKTLIEEHESATAFVRQSYHSFVFCDDLGDTALGDMHMPPCDSQVRKEGVRSP